MHVLKIREIQLGLIILFAFFIISLFSGLDTRMILTHTIVLDTMGIILVILMLNLILMIHIPKRGKLVLISNNDEWFINAYKMIYFILFFSVLTIISSLLNYSLFIDRAQNIFTLGMFITNIYYLLIALWTSLNFVLMSEKTQMQEFTRKDFLD